MTTAKRLILRWFYSQRPVSADEIQRRQKSLANAMLCLI